MFVGLHALLAARTGVPELELTEAEGDQFMKAAQNVMRHYSVRTTQKTMDTIAFFGVCAGIYGPRIAAVRFRKAAEPPAKHKGAANGFANNVEIFPNGVSDGLHQGFDG